MQRPCALTINNKTRKATERIHVSIKRRSTAFNRVISSHSEAAERSPSRILAQNAFQCVLKTHTRIYLHLRGELKRI